MTHFTNFELSWAVNYPQAGLHPVSQLWHPGALGISSCLQSILKGLDSREKKKYYMKLLATWSFVGNSPVPLTRF